MNVSWTFRVGDTRVVVPNGKCLATRPKPLEELTHLKAIISYE